MIYELIEVDKQFRSKSQAVKILKSVSVKIPEGKITVVSGPSGSGKSTLLNILFGIEDVTHGEVRYKGELLEEIEDLSRIWRTELSYLTQVPQTLEYMRVRENMEFMSPDHELIDELLDKLGLSNLWKSYPSELSGGELQRLALGMLLVKKPKILLLDEPTANLDQETASKVISLLKEMQMRYNMSLIISTHDPKFLDIADLSLKIVNGKLTS